MPRSLVFLIIFVAIVVAGMFFLASIDTETDVGPIEKPVIGDEIN